LSKGLFVSDALLPAAALLLCRLLLLLLAL
jgi:hypothetical protein